MVLNEVRRKQVSSLLQLKRLMKQILATRLISQWKHLFVAIDFFTNYRKQSSVEKTRKNAEAPGKLFREDSKLHFYTFRNLLTTNPYRHLSKKMLEV